MAAEVIILLEYFLQIQIVQHTKHTHTKLCKCEAREHHDNLLQHSFFLRPWKKLAHSKQVFLLPAQKMEGIPTESHQVFHQKENQIWTTHLSNLQEGKEKNILNI